MFQVPYQRPTMLKVNQTTPGESIETQVEKLMHTKEPLGDPGAPLIFTERKEGIKASTNIRTDRWEIAIEAMDKVAKSWRARREEKGRLQAADKEPAKQDENEAKTTAKDKEKA